MAESYHVKDYLSSEMKYEVVCLDAQTGALKWRREGLKPSIAQGLPVFAGHLSEVKWIENEQSENKRKYYTQRFIKNIKDRKS